MLRCTFLALTRILRGIFEIFIRIYLKPSGGPQGSPAGEAPRLRLVVRATASGSWCAQRTKRRTPILRPGTAVLLYVLNEKFRVTVYLAPFNSTWYSSWYAMLLLRRSTVQEQKGSKIALVSFLVYKNADGVTICLLYTRRVTFGNSC